MKAVRGPLASMATLLMGKPAPAMRSRMSSSVALAGSPLSWTIGSGRHSSGTSVSSHSSRPSCARLLPTLSAGRATTGSAVLGAGSAAGFSTTAPVPPAEGGVFATTGVAGASPFKGVTSTGCDSTGDLASSSASSTTAIASSAGTLASSTSSFAAISVSCRSATAATSSFSSSIISSTWGVSAGDLASISSDGLASSAATAEPSTAAGSAAGGSVSVVSAAVSSVTSATSGVGSPADSGAASPPSADSMCTCRREMSPALFPF
mmetsp:Transcript_29432/g.82986  ORF Transcript_29432/g.82986 Transcript_29432/m.82986 type:complete len:264 (-) Transcript_29432:355-1146(-)